MRILTKSAADLLRVHTEELRHFMRCSSLGIQATPDVNIAAAQPGRAVRSAEVCVVSVQLAGLVNTKAELQKVAKRLKGAASRDLVRVLRCL